MSSCPLPDFVVQRAVDDGRLRGARDGEIRLGLEPAGNGEHESNDRERSFHGLAFVAFAFLVFAFGFALTTSCSS